MLVNISEIKRPALVANLVGQNIAQQIVKKINYRRACRSLFKQQWQLVQKELEFA